MVKATATPRLRSRRFPPLRVVSPTHTHVRHAAVIHCRYSGELVFEVFDFDEFDRLARTELIGTTRKHLLPGLGWLVIREANGENERADILDLQQQAAAAIKSANQ